MHLYNEAVAKYRHLSRAPIHEAVIEIRFKPPAATNNLDALKSFHSPIKNKYPKMEELHQFGGIFEFGIESKLSTTTLDHGIKGFRFISEDHLQIVTASLTAFNFSRLKPYETWEKMSEEAFALWQLFKKTIKPERVTRVATRFINRLEIPLPIRNFGDYFTCGPDLPKKMPQLWSNFFVKIQMHEPKIDAVSIFQFGLEPLAQKDKTTFLLDIDVIKDGNYERDDQIWRVLGKLRKLKNLLFFESITEKTARMFQ